MELKLKLTSFEQMKCEASFNRTFMELKHGIVQGDGKFDFVLIGPSWNWNRIEPHWRFTFYCFNRTFMELKQTYAQMRQRAAFVLIGPSWNWNVLPVDVPGERKAVLIGPSWNWNRASWYYYCSRRLCFNRTFMELKQNFLKNSRPLNLF